MGTQCAHEDHPDRSAIILADAGGTRRRSFGGQAARVPVQFTGPVGAPTMLEQMRQRLAAAACEHQTVTVLNREHERHYAGLMHGVAQRNMVVQPGNRGSAPAVLFALMRLARMAPLTSVAMFPADLHLSDHLRFMRHVNLAFGAVEARPDLAVILGMAALSPEESFGWIEPGDEVDAYAAGVQVRMVKRLMEQPPRAMAIELMRRGCLWNSMVLVGRVSTLLALMMIAQPDLFHAFDSIREYIGSPHERAAIDLLYRDLPEVDFSSDVLSQPAFNLAVLPVSGVIFVEDAAPLLETGPTAPNSAAQSKLVSA